MLNLTFFVAAYISTITYLTLRGLSLGKYSDIEPTKMRKSSSVAKSNGNIFFIRRCMNRSSRVL